MQRLEVSAAVRPIYGSLGVKRLIDAKEKIQNIYDFRSFSFNFNRINWASSRVLSSWLV